MIVPNTLRRKFGDVAPLVEEVKKDASEALINFCDDEGFPFIGRKKSRESLAEKIESGRFRNWNELNDLYACTVIVPTLSEEDEVIQRCNSIFDCQIVLRGSKPKNPSQFRFDDTRITAHLKRLPGLERTAELTKFDIPFEIQVKSAFEHAWTVTTHSLVYKSDRVDWRDIRLAAQMKAMVEQLDGIIIGFDKFVADINGSPWQEFDEKRELWDCIRGFFASGALPGEMEPKVYSRFIDNLWSLVKDGNNKQSVGAVIEFLRAHFYEKDPGSIPRTISILQYIMAILIDGEQIKEPRRKYWCHVTPELIDFFPAMAKLKKKFSYE